MAHADDDWFTCPVCGEVVAADALACPGCGSDDETGWSEESAYDAADLPDAAFGEPSAEPTRGSGALFRITAFALLLLILLLVLMGVW